jgi:hypothetical protein
MNMTFDIPQEVQAQVAGISGLDLRVALFLRHEAQLEAARCERHSGLARQIAERALAGAEADKLTGFDRERAFDDLERAHRQITERL